MKKFREPALFLLLLLAGFGYRHFLSSGAYQGLYSDMYRHHEMALGVLDGKWAADCCEKNPGYPVFLAGVYRLFGPDNTTALHLVQLGLDLAAAVFVYFAARNLFGKKTGILAFILYLSNPFTSAFGGMRLSENLTFLIMSLIALTASLPRFKDRPVSWILFGITFGLLVFVKASFYLWTLIVLVAAAIAVFSKRKRIVFGLLSVTGFLIASSYTLTANYVTYGIATPVLPYAAKWRDMYFSFYKDFRWPELHSEAYRSYVYSNHPVMTPVYFAFFATPIPERRAFDLKYRNLFFEKLKTDWPLFLKNMSQNVVWLWDKYHLSQSVDPFYPNDELPLRIYNIIILAFGAFGLVRFALAKKAAGLRHPLFIVTVSLILYITFVFPPLSNETRHTLPFYVLLFVWVAYALTAFRFPKT